MVIAVCVCSTEKIFAVLLWPYLCGLSRVVTVSWFGQGRVGGSPGLSGQGVIPLTLFFAYAVGMRAQNVKYCEVVAGSTLFLEVVAFASPGVAPVTS